MKNLSLYVDKWFIAVAISNDGNLVPLTLPNGEDRIWLYFFEDISNSRIEYGKAFENSYRDRLPHYFGDIFDLINTGDHYFTRYERRQEEMRNIFKVSGIFNHIRQAVGEDGAIATYVCFSADIPDVARLRFIEELEEDNFHVVESEVRIQHLALEECRKSNLFTSNGFYLVLVATNDNLHYSLYEGKENLFVRGEHEGTLLGLGFDVRRRALIEAIVNNINGNTKLLKNNEEINLECVRQERNASAWLEKIKKSKRNMPVAFDGITFAVAPHNPATVQVIPKKLDDRTTGIVDDIIRSISSFVKENQLLPNEIKGIVFIGDPFTNETFKNAINNNFGIGDERMVTYKEENIPEVVSIYSQIDLSPFKNAMHKFLDSAKTQEQVNRQKKEEEEKRQKAEASARQQQALIDARKKAEREYGNAVENIERHESAHNYDEMLEWAEIALANKPDDEFAKEKAALARQLSAEQKAANKQFNTVLQRAKTAFAEERWNDAVSQCGVAIELRPNSEEASHLKAEALRRMEIKEKVQTFLNRADVFFAQKLFNEALGEVKKILSLDPSNHDAKAIRDRIAKENAKHRDRIDSLVTKLDDAEGKQDYATAITVCESLIGEDSTNIGKWTGKKERLISKQREVEEGNRKINELRRDINQAHFDEDWVKLKLLCESFLSMWRDDDVAQFLAKAKKRIEETMVQEAKEKALATINGLIINGKVNEAEKELDRFAQNYPSEHSLVKDLRKKLFSFDSDGVSQPDPSRPPHKPIGFSRPSVGNTQGDDDFFGPSKRQVAPQRRRAKRGAAPTKSPKEGGFFDSGAAPRSGETSQGARFTDDDFNF